MSIMHTTAKRRGMLRCKPSESILQSTRPVLQIGPVSNQVQIIVLGGRVQAYVAPDALSKDVIKLVHAMAPERFRADPSAAKRWSKWMVYADPDWLGLVKHQDPPTGPWISFS